MQYKKIPLTFDQQADLLIDRGLIAERDRLVFHLKSVNYYRIAGYLYPFRAADDKFKPGTTFDMVWRHYTFDRRLRVLLLDAVERVEVAIRTQFAYHFSHGKGPFGHLDCANLPKLSPDEYGDLLKRLKKDEARSKEQFVKDFKLKYGDVHAYLPFWFAAEIMSFGMLIKIFQGVEREIKRRIAAVYGIPERVLLSWLHSLNFIRNICAHHARVWNRELRHKPLLPNRRKHPEWHVPVEIKNNRVFGTLTILKYLLDKIAPQSRWPSRLRGLLEEYPEIPLKPMGFPADWEENPIWKRVNHE